MNKLIEITVAGILFKVEEAAWETLKNYKESLKNHFSKQMGSNDIIEDIELRMAELMMLKTEGKGFVTEKDISEIIATLGKPFEMDSDSDNQEANYSTYENSSYQAKKRLFRDSERKVLGGVCGGLGAYFDLDPVWIRLAFAISFFFFGTGLLFYIILWVVIPETRTAADRLQMKGEKVTAESIGNFFSNESENLKKKFNDFEKSDELIKWKQHSRRAGNHIASGAGQLLKYIGKFISLIFVAIAFIFLIIFVISYFGLYNKYALLPVSGIPFLSALYENNWEGLLVITGFTFLICIPLVMIISKGISLIAGNKKLPKYYSTFMGVFWGLSWVVLIAMGFRTAQLFSVTATSSNIVQIPNQDTLIITGISKKDNKINYKFNFSGTHINGKYNHSFTPTINILKTKQDQIYVEMEKEACGKSQENALYYAQKIPNGFENDAQYFHLSSIYNFDDNQNKWRNQQLELNLYIPIGKKLLIEKSAFKNIDEIESELDEDELKGKMVIMTKDGLIPL